jgi:hypothetical protein
MEGGIHWITDIAKSATVYQDGGFFKIKQGCISACIAMYLEQELNPHRGKLRGKLHASRKL